MYEREFASQSVSETAMGYQKRYNHLRRVPDVIAGRMNEDANESWLAAQYFTATAPSINTAMEVQSAEVEHIFQDQTADAIQVYVYADNRIGKRCILPRGNP